MIPEFDERGFLPVGVHRCTAEQFLLRFAEGEQRAGFGKALRNIINYAASSRAESILVGGSFITDKHAPEDVDCVILFRVEGQIPPVRDGLDFDAKRVDIFFASKDQESIVKSFYKLFSTTISGEPVGVVEIVLRDGSRSYWNVDWEPDEDTFEIVKRVYLGRRYVDTVRREKVLVTVHGIRSHAEWNAEVTLIAGANGWVVAPFHYGYVNPTVFVSRDSRQEIVDKFRDFLSDVRMIAGVTSVSVLAHSFGTYVAMNYIMGFDQPPMLFDTMILTGAILDENLDFTSLNGKVGHVINEIAPNDEWAEWAKVANFGRDEMFGNAATSGFNYAGERLTQHRSTIFTHNNVIRRDVMVARWMPALEANAGSAYRDSIQLVLSKHRAGKPDGKSTKG
jgi:pimeloyl-ACP methyl ester carboxylesterase